MSRSVTTNGQIFLICLFMEALPISIIEEDFPFVKVNFWHLILMNMENWGWRRAPTS